MWLLNKDIEDLYTFENVLSHEVLIILAVMIVQTPSYVFDSIPSLGALRIDRRKPILASKF